MSERQPIFKRDPIEIRAEYERRIQRCFSEQWRLAGTGTMTAIGFSGFVEVVSPILSIPIPEQYASPIRLFSALVAGVALPVWINTFYQARQLERECEDELRRVVHQ